MLYKLAPLVKIYHNHISSNKKKALTDFMNDSNIVIKSVEKGAAIVVQDASK